MLEIIVLLMILFLFAAGVLSPLGSSLQYFSKSGLSKKDSLEPIAIVDTQASREQSASFLSYLRNEIEADLFPRPTCSVLQRHYDSLVATELENRLALMAE